MTDDTALYSYPDSVTRSNRFCHYRGNIVDSCVDNLANSIISKNLAITKKICDDNIANVIWPPCTRYVNKIYPSDAFSSASGFSCFLQSLFEIPSDIRNIKITACPKDICQNLLSASQGSGCDYGDWSLDEFIMQAMAIIKNLEAPGKAVDLKYLINLFDNRYQNHDVDSYKLFLPHINYFCRI